MDALQMEESLICTGLSSQSYQERAQALETLKTLVKKTAGKHKFRSIDKLLPLLTERLGDSNWSVRNDSINLVTDLVSSATLPDLQRFVTSLFPALLVNLGDTKIVIRKSAVQAVQHCMKISREVSKLVSILIESGLQNPETRIKIEVLALLCSKPLWEPIANPADYSRLIEALINRLKDNDQSVVVSASKAIGQAHGVLGTDPVERCISQMSPSLQQLYATMSKVIPVPLQPTPSQVGFEKGSSKMSQHEEGRRASPRSPASLPPTTQANISTNHNIHHGGTSIGPPSPSNVSISFSRSNTNSAESYYFGILPPPLYARMRESKDSQAQLAAVEELLALIVRVENVTPVLGHLTEFIEFLSFYVTQSNLRIVLAALQALGQVVTKVGWPIRNVLPKITSLVVVHLGDSKLVLRQAAVKVFNRLMQTLSPGPVLELLLTHIGNENWRVREELVNVVILALSTFPVHQFDFPRLVKLLSSGLTSSNTRVRYVVVEAFAVMNSLMGHESLKVLLLQEIDDAQWRVLNQRFQAQHLPVISKEGLVEHPQSNDMPPTPTEAFRSRSNTDSSLHRTMRKDKSLSKLPWEQEKQDSVVGEKILSLDELDQQLAKEFAKPSSTQSTSSSKPKGNTYSEIFARKMQKGGTPGGPPSLPPSTPSLPRPSSLPAGTDALERRRGDSLTHEGDAFPLPSELPVRPYSTSTTKQVPQRTASQSDVDPPNPPFLSRTSRRSLSQGQFEEVIPTTARMARPFSHKSADQKRRPPPIPIPAGDVFSTSPLGSPTFRDLSPRLGGMLPSAPSNGISPTTSTPAPILERPPSADVIMLDDGPMGSSTRPPRSQKAAPPATLSSFPAKANFMETSSLNIVLQDGPSSLPRLSKQLPLPVTTKEKTTTSSTNASSYIPSRPSADQGQRSPLVARKLSDELPNGPAKNLGSTLGSNQSSNSNNSSSATGPSPSPSSELSSSSPIPIPFDNQPIRPANNKKGSFPFPQRATTPTLADAASFNRGNKAGSFEEPSPDPILPEKKLSKSQSFLEAEKPPQVALSTRTKMAERSDSTPFDSLDQTPFVPPEDMTKKKSDVLIRVNKGSAGTSHSSNSNSNDGSYPSSPRPLTESPEDMSPTRLFPYGSPRGTAFEDPRSPSPHGGTRSVSPDGVPPSPSSTTSSSPSPWSAKPRGPPSVKRRIPDSAIDEGNPSSDDPPDSASSRASTRAPRPPKGEKKLVRRDSLSSIKKTNKGSGAPGEAYLVPVHDLEPFTTPDTALKAIFAALKKGDVQETWTEKCDGLTGIRRLAAYHAQVLLESLHSVVLALIAEVANLRSAVSRLAIVTLGDMFALLGRAMDPELEGTFVALQNKEAAEANVFIKEDVARTLQMMIENVSPNKALVVVLGSATHKNAAARKSCAKTVSDIVHMIGLKITQMKEMDRLLAGLAQLVQDNIPDTRYHARRVLALLLESEDIEKIISKSCTEPHQRALKQAIEFVRTKGVGELAPDSKMGRTTSGPDSTPSRRGSLKQASTPTSRSVSRTKPSGGTLNKEELIAPILADFASSDFRQREKGLSDLVSLVSTRGEDLLDVIPKLFFPFIERLGDSNSKVNLQALLALNIVVKQLGDALEPVLADLLPAVASNLASKNSPIRDAANGGLIAIIDNIDANIVVQPLCNTMQGANIRVREALCDLFVIFIPTLYASSPRLLNKHILPIAFELLNETKGALRQGCVRICVALYESMGDGLLESAAHLNEIQRKSLNQILASLSIV